MFKLIDLPPIWLVAFGAAVWGIDRLVPITDGNQDNQAVYVGTQFRF